MICIPPQLTDRQINEFLSSLENIEGFLPPHSSRYLEREVIPYVSPMAIYFGYGTVFLRTYAKARAEIGCLQEHVCEEILEKVRPEKLDWKRYRKIEREIKHDVRALVRHCWELLSDEAKSPLYLALTSYDLLDTAYRLACRDVGREVLIPKAIEFAETMIKRGEEHADTVMIGRTHRQHAVATTVQLWICDILNNFMQALYNFDRAIDELTIKTTGFVGTDAAKRMLYGEKAREINKKMAELLNMKLDQISSQIASHYPLANYFSQLYMLCAPIEKFADDIRSYQQVEVGEIFESFLPMQVGSSTGPHKRNPIKCEQISGGLRSYMKSMLMMCLEDFEQEFQRVLKDSSRKRVYVFGLVNTGYRILRIGTDVAESMTIRKEKMAENLGLTRRLICAEPLQNWMQYWIAETGKGFVDAHAYVTGIVKKAQAEERDFIEVAMEDELVQQALSDAPEEVREMITDPKKYIGFAKEMAKEACSEWKEKLKILNEKLNEKIFYP